MTNDVGCVIVFPVENDSHMFECHVLTPEERILIKKMFEKKVLLPDSILATAEYVKSILEE